MTTTVKVSAHCADNINVEVTRTKGLTEQLDVAVLKDGEEHECVVYDDIAVSVKEVPV